MKRMRKLHKISLNKTEIDAQVILNSYLLKQTKKHKMSEYKSLRNISNLARTHVPYLKNYKAFIGGKWQSASNEVTFPVFNPANGEKLADVSDLHHDDVAKAIFTAAQAFQSWKATSVKV